LILVLGKSFRQESKFFAGTFNALPLLANLDDKAFTAAEVRYERGAEVRNPISNEYFKHCRVSIHAE
jgi:hypothetical protein